MQSFIARRGGGTRQRSQKNSTNRRQPVLCQLLTDNVFEETVAVKVGFKQARSMFRILLKSATFRITILHRRPIIAQSPGSVTWTKLFADDAFFHQENCPVRPSFTLTPSGRSDKNPKRTYWQWKALTSNIC